MLMLFAASALLTASIRDFPLENGPVIPHCKVTYRTYGKMDADRSNVVVIPTWFNGLSEDWEKYIRPGGIVDPAKYYVIVMDALGDGNSSSPSNTKAFKPQKFPQFTVHDMV